jgi:hypothetical protein
VHENWGIRTRYGMQLVERDWGLNGRGDWV